MAAGLTGQTPVMDVLSAIRSKRDTRAFTDQQVPDDVLGRVLEARPVRTAAPCKEPLLATATKASSQKIDSLVDITGPSTTA